MEIKFKSLFFLLFASCFLYQEANGQCSAVAAAPTGSITPSTLCQQGGTLIGSTAADATTLASGYARLYLLVDNATGIVVDNETTVAALTAPANATNADIIYSVYSLVYTLAEFGTADITNGTSIIIVGDANVITDNDGDPLLATPTVASCMDLSPAAATTVTVGKSLDFIYDNFYICGNTPANIDLSSDIAGLQVTWTASSAGGVTGFTNQATPVTINAVGSFDITDVLSNTSASPATVVYIVTPQLGSCFGNPISITQTVLPNLGIAITSTTCNGTDYNVAFAITGGSGGFTVYNDAGTVVYTPDNATGTVTGIPYGMLNLTLEDMEGCTSDVTNTTNSPQVVITSFTAGCAGGAGTGTLNTTATGAATLSYNIGAGSQTSGSFSGLADNIYTVTVTGGNGCSATSTATVSCTPTCSAVAAAPTGSITPSTLCQDGGTLTGSTAADVTPLVVGYARLYLLVDNASGVIVDNQTTVAALTAPANATNADITYSVYSLVYSLAEFGTADITNGTSTIIVGDANVITDNDGDPLLASPTVISCMDLSAAAATTVTVSRSLTFIYDNFYICDNVSADISLSSDIAGLQVTWTASNTAGTVTGFANNAIPTSINNTPTIYITDVLNNTGSTTGTVTYIVTPQLGGCFGDTIHIDKDVLPDFGIAITSTTCNGSDYDVAFAITGGSGGFTVYNYDNSNVTAGTLNYTPDNTTGTVTSIPFGTINLLIDDVEGCTATTTTTINLPSNPLITVTNSTCTTGCSPSGGSFTVITACTNSTLTYYTDAAGTMGATTTAPVYAQSGPAQTIYYACVDLNACKSAIQTVTTVPGTCTTPTAGLNNNGPLTCTTTSVTLTGTGSGTYAYSGGSSTVSTAGTYTVTVTSANGCTATATTEVMQDITTPIITSFTAGCSGGTGTGTLTTTATGVATLSYDIGTGSQTSGLFTGLADNTYTVTVTSGNGCTATSSATVSCVPICPVLTAAAPAVVINNQSTCTACTLGGGVVAAPLGSCPVGSTLQYSTDNGTLWSTTLPTYNQTTPITILTRCNCGIDNLVSSPTSTVTTAPGVCTPVSASIAGTTNVACGAAISLSALPASAATYAWSGPNAYAANTASINRPGATAAMSGDYTVTVTTANGCTSTASTNVTVGACTGFTFNFGFFDPCICQNDASTLVNGTFNELAGVTFVPQTIGSITSVPSDFVITVQSSTGTIGLTNGTILTYNPGFTRWDTPVFQHVDNIGYTATFEVTAAAGNQFGIAAGTVLGLVSGSNKCAYPDPIFSPAVPAAFCTSDAAFILGANHTDSGPAGAATFYIDSSTPPATATGTPVTQISPVLLGVGAHTIRLDYLGGNNGNVSPDNGVTPAFPGCIQSVIAPTNVSICAPGCAPNSGAWAP